MSPAESNGEPNPFKSILAGLIPKQLDPEDCRSTLFPLLHEVMDYVQTIVDSLESSGQSPATSCASGCSYCCHSIVSLIPAEVLLIHSFVQANFDGPALEALKGRINHVLTLTQGTSDAQRYALKKQTPCIFLEKKICSIYSVRPLICRSWNSLDKSDCTVAFHSLDPRAEIETSPMRNYVYSTARGVFADMSRQMALETETLEMAHGVFNCLNLSDPLSHWLAGGELSSLSLSLPALNQE